MTKIKKADREAASLPVKKWRMEVAKRVFLTYAKTFRRARNRFLKFWQESPELCDHVPDYVGADVERQVTK